MVPEKGAKNENVIVILPNQILRWRNSSAVVSKKLCVCVCAYDERFAEVVKYFWQKSADSFAVFFKFLTLHNFFFWLMFFCYQKWKKKKKNSEFIKTTLVHLKIIL